MVRNNSQIAGVGAVRSTGLFNMRRRLLIITKDPEFDSRDEVVLGQCEPFTSGWTLTLIDNSGGRENLTFGTYTDLRKIQESCLAIDEPADIRKRVKDMSALLTSAVTETVAILHETQRNLGATNFPPIPSAIPTHTPGGLLNVEPNEGVLVATVVQPDRAADAHYFKDELLTLLDCRPRAVVVDLGQALTISADSFKDLADVRDRLKASGAGFALCNVASGIRQSLQLINHRDALPVFETQASALAAIKAG